MLSFKALKVLYNERLDLSNRHQYAASTPQLVRKSALQQSKVFALLFFLPFLPLLPDRGGYDGGLEALQHPYLQDLYRMHTLAAQKRGSLASLDGMRRDARWRDPNLREVICMLGHPMDPVKANAAAYLQHLCYENDQVKQEVRQLRGVPVLVGLLDHPKAEVHRKACGALRNISFGKDHLNKVAIRNCDGIPALIRLLRKSNDMEVRELVTGTDVFPHNPCKTTHMTNVLLIFICLYPIMERAS